MYTIMEEELGGAEAFIDDYFRKYIEQLEKGTLDTKKVCQIVGK